HRTVPGMMPEVLIRYCLPCRYQPQALQDADAILKEFGPELSGLRLVPGDHGVYDVEVDGQVVFSMDRVMRFPETGELVRTIRDRLGESHQDRKSTRLNSSHLVISYAVFCLKKKNKV